jgi:membrane-bound lytic murein transglycosylase D
MRAKEKFILGLGFILLSHSYFEYDASAAPLFSELSDSPADFLPVVLISTDKISEASHTGALEASRQSTKVSDNLTVAPEAEDLWQHIRAKFVFKANKHRRITQLTDRLRHDNYHFRVLAQRAQPFLHTIVTALEKRNLPMELSLLPMIESGFQPSAVSHRHAAGLWQITAPTGRHLGLKSDRWYDGRYDIHASTEAALDYLEYLHRSFGGDWFLALAAYNAGEGTVRRAIRVNKRLGKPVDYWNLKLPPTTRLYVPKLLALAKVINNPNQYQVSLPKIPNIPHLVNVEVGPRMRLAELATLAGTTTQQIKYFNAALQRDITPPDSPYSLWLPPKNAHVLVQRLANFTTLHNDYHIVKRGDTLYGIAQDYQLSHQDLARWNNIDVDGLLMPGQKLLIEPFQS